MNNKNIISGLAFLIPAMLLSGCQPDTGMEHSGSTRSAEAVNQSTEQQKVEQPETGFPDKETLDCLVIGNSISYYNNLPEMVERITEAGTGKKVSVNSIVYTARQADEHGEAIHAALRTQGRSEALTEEEKKLFRYRENLSEEGEYRKEVFDEYAKALLDKGKVRQYDYLIIQDHGRDQVYEESRDGILSIVHDLADENTRIILNMPNYRLYEEEPLDELKKTQTKSDQIEERIREDLEQSDAECGEVKIAYTGRALFNYLYYFGEFHMMKKAPDEYTVYEKEDVKAENDMLLEKRVHTTQIGTYLSAAAIYSAMSGKDAQNTVDDYRAQVGEGPLVSSFLGYGTNPARMNGEIQETGMLEDACFIADQTQNHAMNLASKADTEAWKKDPEKENRSMEYRLPRPEGLQASGKNGKKVIRWRQVDDAEKYLVYRMGEYGWERLGMTTKPSYTDRDIRKGKKYTYTVRCVNKKGDRYLSDYMEKGVTS